MIVNGKSFERSLFEEKNAHFFIEDNSNKATIKHQSSNNQAAITSSIKDLIQGNNGDIFAFFFSISWSTNSERERHDCCS
jgi:hypothetical protein